MLRHACGFALANKGYEGLCRPQGAHEHTARAGVAPKGNTFSIAGAEGCFPEIIKHDLTKPHQGGAQAGARAGL